MPQVLSNAALSISEASSVVLPKFSGALPDTPLGLLWPGMQRVPNRTVIPLRNCSNGRASPQNSRKSAPSMKGPRRTIAARNDRRLRYIRYRQLKLFVKTFTDGLICEQKQ